MAHSYKHIEIVSTNLNDWLEWMPTRTKCRVRNSGLLFVLLFVSITLRFVYILIKVRTLSHSRYRNLWWTCVTSLLIFLTEACLSLFQERGQSLLMISSSSLGRTSGPRARRSKGLRTLSWPHTHLHLVEDWTEIYIAFSNPQDQDACVQQRHFRDVSPLRHLAVVWAYFFLFFVHFGYECHFCVNWIWIQLWDLIMLSSSSSPGQEQITTWHDIFVFMVGEPETSSGVKS